MCLHPGSAVDDIKEIVDGPYYKCWHIQRNLKREQYHIYVVQATNVLCAQQKLGLVSPREPELSQMKPVLKAGGLLCFGLKHFTTYQIVTLDTWFCFLRTVSLSVKQEIDQCLLFRLGMRSKGENGCNTHNN